MEPKLTLVLQKGNYNQIGHPESVEQAAEAACFAMLNDFEHALIGEGGRTMLSATFAGSGINGTACIAFGDRSSNVRIARRDGQTMEAFRRQVVSEVRTQIKHPLPVLPDGFVWGPLIGSGAARYVVDTVRLQEIAATSESESDRASVAAKIWERVMKR